MSKVTRFRRPHCRPMANVDLPSSANRRNEAEEGFLQAPAIGAQHVRQLEASTCQSA